MSIKYFILFHTFGHWTADVKKKHQERLSKL